jgi:hypothetical protein
LFSVFRNRPLSTREELLIAGMFSTAAIVSIATFLAGMRTGVRALQEMDRTPS